MLQGHSWHYMVPHACSARTGLGPVLQSMYSKCFVLTTRFCQHRCHATDETAAACIDRGSLDSSQAPPPLLGRSRAEPPGKEAACDTAHPLAALTPALLTPPPPAAAVKSPPGGSLLCIRGGLWAIHEEAPMSSAPRYATPHGQCLRDSSIRNAGLKRSN